MHPSPGPHHDCPLQAITQGPAQPSGLVVWLHGPRASGDDFVPVLPRSSGPTCASCSPTHRCDP